jgi:hypothetical protein
MAYPVAMDTQPSLPQDLWEQTPPEVRAYIGTLEARVATLEALVHTLQEQVRALQEQLKQTSRNASRPPSSDPPQPPRPRRPRSQRRHGGQLGHQGHTRTRIPVEAVEEVVVLKPDVCRSCHAPLWGDDAKPFRHQVIEMPPIKPVVTEYQWHALVCSACGETTRAPWPAGVPSRTYGPRIQAIVSLCTGVYRLSKRMTQKMMAEVCGVPMSVGTISQLEQATTAALAAPVPARSCMRKRWPTSTRRAGARAASGRGYGWQ